MNCYIVLPGNQQNHFVNEQQSCDETNYIPNEP